MWSHRVRYDHDFDQGRTVDNFLGNLIDDSWYSGHIMRINLVPLNFGAERAGSEVVCGRGMVG